jgi:hypothetical protein
LDRFVLILWSPASSCGSEPHFANSAPALRITSCASYLGVYSSSLLQGHVPGWRSLTIHIPCYRVLAQHHASLRNMATAENEPTTFRTSLRTNLHDTAIPSSTNAEQPSHAEASHPSTTYAIAVTTDTAQSQSTAAPLPNETHTTSLPFSSDSLVAMSSANPSSTPTHARNITRVGTVVSISDVPAAWGPKYPQAEQARQTLVLTGMSCMFLVLVVAVIGKTLWK